MNYGGPTSLTSGSAPGADAALRAARELHSATELLLDAVARRYGINRNDLHCLEIIEREGPVTAGALARLSHLSPAAVTKVIDRLAWAGYVIRRPSTDDRRAQVIAISTEHAELRTGIWGPVAGDALAVLGELAPAELGRFTEVLTRLAAVNREHASIRAD